MPTTENQELTFPKYKAFVSFGSNIPAFFDIIWKSTNVWHEYPRFTLDVAADIPGAAGIPNMIAGDLTVVRYPLVFGFQRGFYFRDVSVAQVLHAIENPVHMLLD